MSPLLYISLLVYMLHEIYQYLYMHSIYIHTADETVTGQKSNRLVFNKLLG